MVILDTRRRRIYPVGAGKLPQWILTDVAGCGYTPLKFQTNSLEVQRSAKKEDTAWDLCWPPRSPRYRPGPFESYRWRAKRWRLPMSEGNTIPSTASACTVSALLATSFSMAILLLFHVSVVSIT